MPRGYAVCCTARSGSTLLCEALESTGVLGRPREYFNANDLKHQDPDYPRDGEGQLAAIVPRATTPNGVYGFKMLSYQVDQQAPGDWAARLPNLNFVYLYRRDVLRQAISDVRAMQTQAYRQGQVEQTPAVYDAQALTEKIRTITRQDSRWRVFFARNGIEPLHVAYETFLAAPQPVLDAIGRLVGVESPRMAPGAISVRMQRDALTEAWRDRFIGEHRDLARFD